MAKTKGEAMRCRKGCVQMAGKGSPEPTPKRKVKKSSYVKAKMHISKVKELSEKTRRELIQYMPFERMIKKSLDGTVTRVSSEVVVLMMEAVTSYIHSIVTSAFTIAATSGKRTTLMVRDMACAVEAKSDRIVGAPL